MRQKLVDHIAARVVAQVHKDQAFRGWAGALHTAAWAHMRQLRLSQEIKRLTAEARNAIRFGL
jgi:hypothetical protein